MTEVHEQAGARPRGRKTLVVMLGIAGALLLVVWSFVLPILGILYVVEKLG